MKRVLAILLTTVLLAAVVLTGCTPVAPSTGGSTGGQTTAPTKAPEPVKTEATDDANVKVLNLWSFTNEIPNMLDKYKELNPSFNLEVKTTIIATTDGAYQPALDQALAAGGADAPDIYAAESAFVLKYTQGDAAEYAAPYASLGIDVANKLKEADIAQYTVDIGTRPADGQLVGLGYQATGGALIYRRSLAKDTWGSDDPTVVKTKVGPGWDKYFAAAKDLKAKGYAIVSGDGDLWHAVEGASEKGWIVGGKLYIDPSRDAFLDQAKLLKDNAWHNDTQDWTDAWFADMKDAGPQKVFGFFGPAWLINYVMSPNAPETSGDWAVCEPPVGFFWGGTWVIANKNTKIAKTVGDIIEWITLDSSKTGLQYFWANGVMNDAGTKDTVASGTVMKVSDGTVPYLGGQNMFDAFVPAGAFATGKNKTQYDETINSYWRAVVREYAAGTKTREQAIKDFKQQVADNLDVVVE